MKSLHCIILSLALAVPLHGQAAKPRPQDNPEFLEKAALKIDFHIASFYRKKKLPVPDVTDDATFLRRAFLVAIGRIPTAEEALAFLEIEDENKRADLVNYLMNSKGYSSHMTNWAFDLLRLRDERTGGQANTEPYREWIRSAMDENMPWDDFVTELLTSSGNGWDPKSAAVGYYTIDKGMPLDNLSNSMRIFTGAHMECAQCHDDPFGETERRDFYHLAAFTNGQDTINERYFKKLWDEIRANNTGGSVEFDVGRLFLDRIYGMSLRGGGEGKIKLPDDYQYRDGDPGELIGAETPFGKTVRMSERKQENNGREQLADWIVNRTGPQFSSVIANRMWKRVMGKGIYEPVDEYIEASDTVYPELVTDIAKLMHELDYDLKAFQHVLLLTKTFQFATNPNPSVVAGGDDFHGRKIERLSAEQIWDSLITLSDGDPDQKPRRSVDNRIHVRYSPVLEGEMDMVQLTDEVLALQSEAEVRKYFNNFMKKLNDSGYSKSNRGKGSDMMSGMAAVTKYGKYDPVRASELPSPAPREHFLYLFGASDRLVVEGATKEPNVGQVLSLMNGYVQKKLVGNSDAHIYKSLEGASSDMEKIRRLYVAILNRPPSEEEMGWMLDEVKNQGEEGFRNIVSALVMSSEFLFLQ
ncbi:DUF1549 domain-containing protein [Luteolibacter algae]|uniref:DUF1549 domain-containing protein n=1 Tax=Luteolibacter algae TaxID=454151 RepID=A0ABW5D7A9_9BACT